MVNRWLTGYAAAREFAAHEPWNKAKVQEGGWRRIGIDSNRNGRMQQKSAFSASPDTENLGIALAESDARLQVLIVASRLDETAN